MDNTLHAGRGDEFERHRVHGARVGRRGRHQYRGGRLPFRVWLALVHRHVLGRSLCHGPATGAIHSASSGQSQRHHRTVWRSGARRGPDRERQGLLAAPRRRCEFLIQAAAQSDRGSQTLTLSDRPELRIDPTTLISTARSRMRPRASLQRRAAGAYGSLLVQGEYFWFNVERNASTGLPPIGAPNLKFDGGYAQASTC